jgi:hypothetical protein
MRRTVVRMAAAVAHASGVAAASSASAAASSSVAAAAAAAKPLQHGQFRVIVRELRAHELPNAPTSASTVRASPSSSAPSSPSSLPHPSSAAGGAVSSALRDRFRALLTVPAPDVFDAADESAHGEEALETHRPPARSAAGSTADGVSTAPDEDSSNLSPARRWASRLARMMGVGKDQPLLHLVQSLHAHSSDPAWQARCGFANTPFSKLQLRALHLWLLHVRLRSPNALDGASANVAEWNSPSSLRRLFELFWAQMSSLFPAQHELLQAHGSVLVGWRKFDEAIVALLQATEQAEEDARSKAHAEGRPPPSPLSVKLPSAQFGAEGTFSAPDRALLGALWWHTFRADPALNPHHLERLLRYTVDSIVALQSMPAEQVAAGKFQWLPPPAGEVQPLTPREEQMVSAYYNMLGAPAKR